MTVEKLEEEIREIAYVSSIMLKDALWDCDYRRADLAVQQISTLNLVLDLMGAEMIELPQPPEENDVP